MNNLSKFSKKWDLSYSIKIMHFSTTLINKFCRRTMWTLSYAFRGLPRLGFRPLRPRLNWQACFRVSIEQHLTCHIIIFECALHRCHEWLLFLSFPVFLVLRGTIRSWCERRVRDRRSRSTPLEINTNDDNDEYLSNYIKTSTRYPKSITLVSTGKGKHSHTTSYTLKVFQFSLCIAYGSKVLLSIGRVILSVAFMFPLLPIFPDPLLLA